LKQKLERQSRIELKQSESQITMKVQDMVEELADTSQLQLSVEELKSKLMLLCAGHRCGVAANRAECCLEQAW
jgi:hypothetical protein